MINAMKSARKNRTVLAQLGWLVGFIVRQWWSYRVEFALTCALAAYLLVASAMGLWFWLVTTVVSSALIAWRRPGAWSSACCSDPCASRAFAGAWRGPLTTPASPA
jgi:hypothetical protein